MAETYETCIEGIRILPGQWRPHFPYEQIAWISPPWPCHDYIWLDFPEAIFTDAGLLYLSHVNPACPTVYQDLPKVPWGVVSDGIAFERALPNGVRFGGSIRPADSVSVTLELWIHNGLDRPLGSIRLQTCAYLRAIAEFSDFTQSNKYVRVGGQWITLEDAFCLTDETGTCSVGWGGGPKVADLPVIAAVSNRSQRLVAMTWHESTLSLTGNAEHPCMHADPLFPDIAPGATETVRGEIVFGGGPIGSFDQWWNARRRRQEQSGT